MKVPDRSILIVVPVVLLIAAFWFIALSPKREKATELGGQVTKLESSVAEQQQAASEGLEARRDFPRDYHRLVVMGKSVPTDDETASLLVQVNRIAEHSGVTFRAIELTEAQSAAPAPTTPAPGEPTATEPPPEEGTPTETPVSTTPAPATEASAATLPIGATVGSAGLPVLPYKLTFQGTFFEIADFMAGIDHLVETGGSTVASDGRLVTIDGFSLSADDGNPFPELKASLLVTTYVTPADQGLTAGATPSGPAAAAPTTTPASTPTTTSTTP
jgi:Tfp pilus assembly protein PilO